MPRNAPEPPQGRWRDALGGYLTAAPDAAPTSFTPLALQLELRELIPRTTYRWNGPVSRAVGRGADASGTYRLGARPVARTARGWSRGNLSWANLPHQLNQQNLDPAQQRWFSQFSALYRAADVIGPGRDTDWVMLDDYTNPVLWAMLEQARGLGIAVVGATGTAVRIGDSVEPVLDVRSNAEGGIRIEPIVVIDGVDHDIRRARAVANHGAYVFDGARPRTIVLAPAASALGPEQLELLGGRGRIGDGLDVPADAVDEFTSGFLPELIDRITVRSGDDSVVLPLPPPPRLVLTVTHKPRHVLELAWHWAHRRRSEPPALADVIPAGTLPDEWLVGEVPPPATLRGIDAAEFATRELSALKRLPGVDVISTGVAADYRELTGTPQLTVATVPSEKTDWFDLGVTVTVDDRTIPFTPLFKALAAGKRRLLLVDGTHLSLQHPIFAPLADLIAEAAELAEWSTAPVISRHQTSLWADFEDLADEAEPALEWRELLADAAGDAPRPVAPPAGLTAELRPYQSEGFSWLAYLWRHRLGGVLADDMGLGKTVQALALIQHAHDTGATAPFLVVAPTSVVPGWITEAAKFTPGLTVRAIASTQASGGQSIADAAAGAHIVVTTYALLRLDFDAYQAVATSTGWSGLVLDEAQFVKNRSSRIHECARDLDVRFTLALTGTPMENSLTELHALFAIVAPGLFASPRRFAEDYVRPIERPIPGISTGVGAGSAPAVAEGMRAERLAKLRRRIRPFMLRRTKHAVATELPEKQEQTVVVELAPEHRELYELYLARERRKLFGLLDDIDRNRMIVFRSLTLLRMLALDASLIDPANTAVPSSKLDALFEQLDDVIAEGHRALIFSQFTGYLRKAADRLDAAGIRYQYLDGSTRDRQAVIEAFKGGDAPVFLISLKAGGFGLNLTEADYVFLLDPWWNPAAEDQAIDRTHRIGQSRNVMVYRMIAADTIEQKVMALGQRKAALFDAVIDDEQLFDTAITADELRELLG